MAIRQYLAISATVSSSGQPTGEEIVGIRAAGFDIVVNLALATSDHALADEALLVEAAGMDYVHIPVIWEHPGLGQFIRFAEVLQANRHRKIWVHCAMNMRVSAFLYLYHVLVMGWQEPDARILLHRIWEPNATWQAFMAEVAGSYAKQNE